MIRCRGLTKVFGTGSEVATALALADEGVGRAEIQRRTGATLAVHDVSFDVAPGELLFVVMGLSGSGKLTLVRLLNRLIEPSRGSIEIDGDDLGGLNDARLRQLRNRRMSMVFQHFALLPHRTVQQNAGYGLQIRGVSDREWRAQWALDQVGLGDRGDAVPAQRKTIVFITHDLNEAMRLGDRILLLKDGRLVQLGTGPEILAAPADDYVADFVSDVDRTRVLTAEDVLAEPRVVVHFDERPGDVLRRLGAAESNGAYVVDGDLQLLGVVKDDWLAHAASTGAERIDRTGLVAEYATTGPGSPLIDIAGQLGRHVVPLAVVDDRNRLLGVVPRAAVLASLPDPRVHADPPVFVYLVLAVFFFGIGVVPGVVATTIFSIPPAVRLTELGIRGVDPEVVEAAHAFGAHPRQILREVQLPMALPSIMAGINQVIMLALSMVVVAGLAGAGGLGSVVTTSVTQLDVATGFEGGLAVVILAIFLDRFTAALARRPSTGLWTRLRRRRPVPVAVTSVDDRETVEEAAAPAQAAR
jgi:glycine betaine/proline transport system ATP-binding protein